MVGRASLTPGRVLALLGLVVALGGLLQRAPEGGTHWGAIGGAGHAVVILGVGVLLVAVFRPDRRRALDLVGAVLEHVVAWGVVALAANMLLSAPPEGTVGLGSMSIAVGACLMLAGVSWDSVAAWRASPAPVMVDESAGTGGRPGSGTGTARSRPVATGVVERAG